jgi:hypothetical protein
MLLLTFVVVVAAATPPLPVPLKKVAVLEVTGEDLDAGYRRALSDAVRQGVLGPLGGTPFSLVERAQVEKILADMKECDSRLGECLLEDARIIQADYVVGGEAVAAGPQVILTLKLLNVRDERTLGIEQVTGQSRTEMLEAARQRAAALVLTGLGMAVRSEMTFGGGAEVRVPIIQSPTRGAAGLRSVNVRAEALFEAAVEAQARKSAAPELKRDAWCDLAQVADNNKYLTSAQEACAGWQKYVDNLERLQGAFEQDYANLGGYLALKRPTTDAKLAAVDEFLGTYAPLEKREPRLAVVKSQRAVVKRGGQAMLPSAAAIELQTQQQALDSEIAERRAAHRNEHRVNALKEIPLAMATKLVWSCLCPPFSVFSWFTKYSRSWREWFWMGVFICCVPLEFISLADGKDRVTSPGSKCLKSDDPQSRCEFGEILDDGD